MGKKKINGVLCEIIAPETSRANAEFISIPKGHKCYGCPMYSRDTNTLFCMMPRCIKKYLRQYTHE